jgi:hypothetical protein
LPWFIVLERLMQTKRKPDLKPSSYSSAQEIVIRLLRFQR